MLGGHGSATEIVHRNKDLSIKDRIFRWHYIARTGWRGVL